MAKHLKGDLPGHDERHTPPDFMRGAASGRFDSYPAHNGQTNEKGKI